MFAGHQIIYLLLLNAVVAIPIFGIGNTSSKANVSTVSAADTDALLRPTRFTQIAYCSTDAILSWTCGASCNALPGIEAVTAGGDDGLIPVYFVAHDPKESSVIVAHQGTDTSKVFSLLNDIKILLVGLDKDTFPNADSEIKVHDGIQQTFKRTASQILGNVTETIKAKGAKKVEVSGHSLGAAIAVMDAAFLRQKLDPSVEIVVRVYGLPRAGNQAWANFVDQTLPGMIHVHNKNDPVGLVPPRLLDYQHPSGEFHIQSDNSTLNCPGQENQDSRCLGGQDLIKDISSFGEHSGPYYGIHMGGSSCV